jgi:hypothetical protein
MTSRSIRLLLISSVTLPLITLAALTRRESLASAQPIPTPSPTAQVPSLSFAYVTVWGANNLDPNTLTLYQSLANSIANYSGVPNSRVAYYASYNDGTYYSIASWGASVTNVVPDGTGAGYIVTLAVGPNFSISTGANPVGDYLELYNVTTAGVVTYLGSQDADGSGGGTLDTIIN